MRKSTVIAACLLVAAGVYWFAQAGDLEPPGPPAPTMKTLDQVESRIPISGPTVITAPGSYLVTQNITAPGPLVDLANGASNVTLDLNGFRLESTSGPVIEVHGPSAVIRNGSAIAHEDYVIVLLGGRVIVENIGARGGGVFAYNTDFLIIRNNVWDFCGSGFLLHTPGVFGPTIVENNILNNCDSGIEIYSTGARIIGNVLNNAGGLVLDIGVGSSGCLIANNIVTASSDSGIFVKGMRNHIEGNVLMGNQYGLTIEGDENIYRANTARGNTNADFMDTGTGNTSHGDNYMPSQM